MDQVRAGADGVSARNTTTDEKEKPVLGVIALLLVVWLVLAVIGAVVEGLFWLLIIGVVLFLATAAYGWMKRNTRV
ncbi:hypothetical protein [Blastococcus sp. SYSU DS0539]